MSGLRRDIARVYCINLDARPDRWQSTQALFRSLGLDDRLVRVPGVLDKEPAVGCTKAHLRAVKQAEKECSPHDLVLICEDDLTLVGPDTSQLVSNLEQALEQRKATGWTQLYWAMTPQQLGPGQGFRQIHVALGGAGTLLTRQGLQERRDALMTSLLQHKPWDVVAAGRQRSLGTVYGFYPAVLRQAPGRSDIEQRDVDYGYLEVGGYMLPQKDRT